MKFKSIVSALIVALSIFIAPVIKAQDTPSQSLLYTWNTPTTTGQLGKYIILTFAPPQGQKPAPHVFTIDWSLSGTVPSACTFRVEGSFDGVNWYGLDTTSPATTSCATSGMESLAYKPVYYLRINVVTWTTGDSTTVAHFQFTGAKV